MRLIIIVFFCITAEIVCGQSARVTKTAGDCSTTDFTFYAQPIGFTASDYAWYVNGSCNSCFSPVSYVFVIPAGSHWNGMEVRCEITSTTGSRYVGLYTISYTNELGPLTVDMTIEPFGYPFNYCSDSVNFKATSNHPADFTWYHNGTPVEVGPTYSPPSVSGSDIIEVTAVSSTQCVSPGTAHAEINLGTHNLYKIDAPLGDILMWVADSSQHQCAGLKTSFFGGAEYSKSISWSLIPSTAGTLSTNPSGSLAEITWSDSFSGPVSVTVTVSGCVDQAQKTIAFRVDSLPSSPLNREKTFCDFEMLKISMADIPNLQPDISYCLWYDELGHLMTKSSELSLAPKPSGVYTYRYKVVNSAGCKSVNAADFKVNVNYGDSCEAKLNSVETISFDSIGNVAGHTKSYFDQTGQLLQTQVRSLVSKNILTSQVVKDQYGRPVISTLHAPINSSSFRYHRYFMTNSDGDIYSYADFGQPPGNTQPGTVGWYYSSNNNVERHVPVTGYPFGQVEFYDDDSGELRKSGGPGEVHKMGSGHEVLSGTFPVFAELNDYLGKRSMIMSDVSLPVVMDGSFQTVARDENGKYQVQIFDKSGRTLMTARADVPTESTFSVSNRVISSGNPQSINYRPMTYFYLLREQSVTITGSSDFIVEDIVKDIAKPKGVTFAGPDGKWPVGFYRILLSDTLSADTILFSNHYSDIAYQFYNDAGRLISSISPNGFKQLKDGIVYESIDKTTYAYNFQGWLMEMTEADAGTTKYIYRKDGRIRFSQNAQQRECENNATTTGLGKGKFSYTNYDQIGRPIESGEYTGSQLFLDQDSVKEFSNQVFYDLRKDWILTHYDFADPDFDSITGLGVGYAQNFTRGAVAWSENSNIKSWYSYDEFGRVVWMAQKPNVLNRVFVIKYKYDFLGNVLTVSNLAYNTSGQLMEQFYHYYEYDADNRLSKVYTSTILDDEKKLRATYEYYLHGPLKRVVLGDSIQGIDFVYNIHGWLTQINHPDLTAESDPGGDNNDVFGMVLDYYESSLSNIYSTTSSSVQESDKHGLPHVGVRNYVRNHQPLIRFSRDVESSNFASPLKGFSAENPQYLKMISNVINGN